MKRSVYIGFFLFLSVNLFATHNRAGEITYRHVGGYTYEFTITTYTYLYSSVRRAELPVSWGDGTSSIVPILNPPGHVLLPNTDYLKNTYVATHTFPGAGVYEILMEDPNRNQGVNNIPNSVNVIFSIKTTMLIGSDIGSNNTPILLNPPIDKAAKGHIFIHNPAAYDPDGDSISYTITTCTGAGGQPIEGYVLPAATDTLLITKTGDLTWITPAQIGVYNIAIWVEEWREGLIIDRIARDMQIDVYETDNNPPVNSTISDTCLLAGDTLNIYITATDADNDQMIQEMVGGSFQVAQSPAIFEVDSSGYGYIYSHYTWATNCTHARHQPYNMVLKTTDVNDDINLVDLTSFNIKVLHRAPEGLEAFPGTDTIRLEWSPSTCGTPAGYRIYRRIGSQAYTPGYCETGVPAFTGYEFLDYVSGADHTYYTDDNHGGGLVPGYDYCYRITAYYSDGAESISSDEVCTTLIPGMPSILRVSVEADDAENGTIDVAWAVPEGEVIDTLDGPFRYEVLRMDPGEQSFHSVAILPTVDLLDTTYTDTGTNTLIFPYTYSVLLYYEEAGSWHQLSGSETATSQYIEIEGSDNLLVLNMKKRAPWLNTQYDVYRQDPSGDFNMIGLTHESVYADSGLKNNTEYTYRTIGMGVRPLNNREYFVQNTSHLATGIPIDTIPPCPPDLFVTSECELDTIPYNLLSWKSPSDTCINQDIIHYVIYSRDSLYGDFEVMDTVGPDVFTYLDWPSNTIEKCYAVTAVDSAYNESLKLPYCVYNICAYYRLPNVFTPNGDGLNDIYLSWNLNGYVKKVNMKIYNRYGNEVYITQDPDINWDGRHNGKLVTSGVYYYICDVFEPRITGTVIKTLTGFIHVYSGDDNVTIE